ESAAGFEVLAHLLNLDRRGFLHWEPAHPSAEGDQRQRLRPELIGLAERGGGRPANDVGRRRAAELHRGRVDYPLGRHLAGGGLDGLAEADRRLLTAFAV